MNPKKIFQEEDVRKEFENSFGVDPLITFQHNAITAEGMKDLEKKYNDPTFWTIYWTKFRDYFSMTRDQYLGIDNTPKRIVVSKYTPKYDADIILEEYKFLKDRKQRFWRYDDSSGIWKEDAYDWLANYIRKNILGDEVNKKHYVNEIISYIEDISYEDIQFDNNINLIAFENGVYDLETDQFINHSPDFFLTNKLNISYNPNQGECKKIDTFFEDLVGKERKSILYDIIAYSMYRSYPYQKLFFLYGSGRNGKSTYINLITHFLGYDNISGETPQSIENNRFAASSLYNRLANISSDISYDELNNTNMLKMLCGGDWLTCERKHKNPFMFKNHAKLIFSTNQLPLTSDKTDSFYRRIYIVDFQNVFDESSTNKNILASLITEDQLQGLAVVCIERLKKMKKIGWFFEIDPDVSKTRTKYNQLANPLIKFLQEMCDIDPTRYVSEQKFLKIYTSWASKNGYNAMNNKNIRKMLNNEGIERDRKGSNKIWCFVGLTWKVNETLLQELVDFIQKGDEVEYSSILDRFKKIYDQDMIDSALKKAMQDGSIYEPIAGKYKVFE